MAEHASLTLDGKSYDLPVIKGTTGPDVVDVRKFYADTDTFTFDPGFTSTASCESKISYIDGDAGVLLHRGYPIQQLAEQSTFLEVCYLLLNGELPNAVELTDFEHTITYHTMLHAQFDRFFSGFRSDAHPMAIMTGAVGALSAFYHDSINVDDPEQRKISAHRLIAKMPTIAARAFKYSVGQPFVTPRNDMTYAENFLRMAFSVPAEDWKPNPILTRAMDRIFILHADHEQNASTSTVRLAGSSGANPFACIAAGIACLWGPSHGGANEEALMMLNEIGTVDRIPEYIQGVKDRKYRLMGFGHRVYKNYDPPGDGDAEDLPRGAGRDRPRQRSDPQGRAGTREDRAQRPLFRRPQTVPQRRFLFGHHPEGDGVPNHHVHRSLRPRPHRRLDQPVEGDVRGPPTQDRPAATALHRAAAAGLCAGGEPGLGRTALLRATLAGAEVEVVGRLRRAA